MSKKVKIIKVDQGYLHEAMTTTDIIQNNIEDFLLKKPTCNELPQVKKLIKAASTNLAAAYQIMGIQMK